MADATTPESENPEGNKESIRTLVKSIAQDQLRVLGYQEILAKLQGWTEMNPMAVGYFYSKEGVQSDEPFTLSVVEQMEGYLRQIKRIPNQDQARKLVAAALFGIPFSEDETGGVVIVSYDIAEPSSKTRLTKLDPNNPGNNVWERMPNVGPTKILAGKVANTGFIPESLVPMDVIRKLLWGEKVFEGVKQDNPSVKMRITPSKTEFHIEIRKSP